MSPRRVLVTRPLPEAEETAARVRALGHECLVEPMLEIRAIPGPPLDLSGLQALLVTSRNGARALAHRTQERRCPVFAVGAATAEALRGLGFVHVESAEGAAADLAELVLRRLSPAAGPILHIRGEAVAGDPIPALRAGGFESRPAVLYETSTPFAFTDRLKRTMRQSALGYALFFSPRTARTFVTLARAAGLASRCADIDACCLSAAVGAGLEGTPWRAVRVSVRPHQDALLELLPGPGTPIEG